MIELWIDELIRTSAHGSQRSQSHWLFINQYTRTLWLSLKAATCEQAQFWYEL